MKATFLKYLYFFLLCFLFHSCKKEEGIVAQNIYEIDKSHTYTESESENRIKEEVWKTYKELSLWEQAILPTNDNLHMIDTAGYIRENYTNYFQTGSDVLNYLMTVTKVYADGYSSEPYFTGSNPYSFYNKIRKKNTNNKNYDWYSFFDRGGFISGATHTNQFRESLGMNLLYVRNQDNSNSYLYVAYVDKNSEAARAGIKRGDRILKLNDDAGIDFNTQQEVQFRSLESYLYSSHLKVEYISSDGNTKVVNLSRSTRLGDVVYKDSIINEGEKKIGYLGFNSFLERTASVSDKGVVKTFKARIDEAIQRFSNANIHELVVDLRYNGGGYVEMQEHIANLIAPQSASGQIMNTYKINRILMNSGATEPGEDFAPVYFSKAGNLSLSRVYFLVSEETASASELLINVLKPYMPVYMIGTYSNLDGKVIANNTYGKPVGFFARNIISSNNKLYVTSFQMFNKDGYGDYFHGLVPDFHVWQYGEFYDFGDKREAMFAAALRHINTGSFGSTQSRSVKPLHTFYNPEVFTSTFGNVNLPIMIKKLKNPQ